MREILFRGKRLDNGEWIEGNYILQYDHNKKEACVFITKQEQDFDNPVFKPIEVGVKTIGQYICKCDKNGRKAFTGDIVRATSELTGKSGIYCLVFDETRLHYGFRTARHGYYYNLDEMLEEEPGDCINFEIIGNIHDNPELLGGVV